jgi:hypothetical protein
MGLSEYQKSRAAHIANGRPLKDKKKYTIPKVSEKRKAKEKEQKEAGSDNTMDLFFKSLRKGMKGKCFFCGGKSQKDNDDNFFFSLAHLLPKSGFPSVATMPENVIELCFYGESCHTNFDNGMITWELLKDSKEWDELKERLFTILPQVAESERKNKLYSKLHSLVYDGIIKIPSNFITPLK